MTIGHIKASELLRIGDGIRILRKNKGWTQKKLAIESGIHEVQIRRYENNHSLPRDEQLQKLTSALGIEIDFSHEWRIYNMAGINNYIRIGKRMKQARIKTGISQKEMAIRLGISHSSYSNYENEYREPGINLIYLFCKEVSMTIDELIRMEFMAVGKNFKMNIDTGKQIKEARVKAKLTQEKLAEKAGISVFTLQKYESGDRNPKIESLQKIANALGIPITQLKSM